MEPLKVTDDFLSVIASRLCLLDNELALGQSNQKQVNADLNDNALKNTKKKYFKVLKGFSGIEEINDSVFIYSLAIAKKVKKLIIKRFTFKP